MVRSDSKRTELPSSLAFQGPGATPVTSTTAGSHSTVSSSAPSSASDESEESETTVASPGATLSVELVRPRRRLCGVFWSGGGTGELRRSSPDDGGCERWKSGCCGCGVGFCGVVGTVRSRNGSRGALPWMIGCGVTVPGAGVWI